jgi:glutamyl-tRNA synthetase
MNVKRSIKVRFAPSPTGQLHIGGVRAALFNWLFARHNKGSFVVRIEDTDLERSTKTYSDVIVDALAWLGMKSDEPLVYQSSLVDHHKACIEKLISEGKAYKCYCSQDDIKKRVGEDSPYDNHCRTHLPLDSNKSYVVRFRIPDDRAEISFEDLILGKITISSRELDDFIIARSDGSPIYNLVVVVDDASMGITHVIRGQEHINNTPKQLLLYEALGLEAPRFAHVPLILGASGAKLSKRDAATSVLDYKKEGYLPEALINYLVRLGWSHGDQEIFTVDELIQHFNLNGVGKSSATFDMKKLRWVNSEYIKKKSGKWILDYLVFLDPQFLKDLSHWSKEQIIASIDLYKERVSTLKELENNLKMFFGSPSLYNEAALEKWVNGASRDLLSSLVVLLLSLDEWDVEHLQAIIKDFVKNNDIKLAQIAQPIRIALTGDVISPGVFHLLSILGKEESLKRLEALVKK